MGYICVVGSLNMDLVVRTPRAPLAGETLTGKDFHLIPGGKGANQAAAAARAGAPTRMVGCIGTDPFGPALLNSLASAGVDVTGVTALEGRSTGTATILVEDGGENRIVIVPGANGLVTSSFIEAQWHLIQGSDLVLLQHEIPLETVHTLIRRAHERRIGVILNPAPIFPVPAELLRDIDVLIMNEVEASTLTDLEVSSPERAIRAARALVRQGVSTAIITLGASGAVLVNDDNELYQPGYLVEAVDTTAAGDTFTGSYAACIYRGEPPLKALKYAAAAAALAVTQLGAQTSIPKKAKVDAFIAANDLQKESRKEADKS